MLADEDWDTIVTYWDVITEMRKPPGAPDSKDGAATLRALGQQDAARQ